MDMFIRSSMRSLSVFGCLSGGLSAFNENNAEMLTRYSVGSAGTYSCRLALRGRPEELQVRAQFSGCLAPGKKLNYPMTTQRVESNASFAWTCFHRPGNMLYSVRIDTFQSHSCFYWSPCHAAIVLVATAGSLHLQRLRNISPQSSCRPRAQHTASPHVRAPVPCGA